MRAFKYSKAKNKKSAIKAAGSGATYLAGGTNLVDLMKEDVARPKELVDVRPIKMDKIEKKGNSVIIGAGATNKVTANHELVRNNFPVLTHAIMAGASAQIRNMATNGGNINQRTRCLYFYDTSMPCNKREAGSGCAAAEGLNRMNAVFGYSDKCVAVHPSDMAVALSALEAKVHVEGKDGKRVLDIDRYFRLPGDDPTKDNNLKETELITAIELPMNTWAKNSYYLKVRDRASYAFALVSVAAGVVVQNGYIRGARIAMGGVAHKPWRAFIAEKQLMGKKPSKELFQQAGEMEMERAKPLSHNGFKVKLGAAAIARALEKAAG